MKISRAELYFGRDLMVRLQDMRFLAGELIMVPGGKSKATLTLGILERSEW